MGILNRTPDSFFDGGRYWDLDAFSFRAEQLVGEGADLLDVGGVRAGPGAEVGKPRRSTGWCPRSPASRVASTCRSPSTPGGPAWPSRPSAPAPLSATTSADSPTPPTCRGGLGAGAAVVATHIRLGPRIPDPDPHYDDVVADVSRFLADRAGQARRAGIPDERIILDAGLDLGKTAVQSARLAAGLGPAGGTRAGRCCSRRPTSRSWARSSVSTWAIGQGRRLPPTPSGSAWGAGSCGLTTYARPAGYATPWPRSWKPR